RCSTCPKARCRSTIAAALLGYGTNWGAIVSDLLAQLRAYGEQIEQDFDLAAAEATDAEVTAIVDRPKVEIDLVPVPPHGRGSRTRLLVAAALIIVLSIAALVFALDRGDSPRLGPPATRWMVYERSESPGISNRDIYITRKGEQPRLLVGGDG